MDEKSMQTTPVSQKQARPEYSRRLRGFALFAAWILGVGPAGIDFLRGHGEEFLCGHESWGE